MARVCFEDVLLSAMDFVEEEDTFYYDCECGDRFLIGLDELLDGEDIADCPSCSLLLRVTHVDVRRSRVMSSSLPVLLLLRDPSRAASLVLAHHRGETHTHFPFALGPYPWKGTCSCARTQMSARATSARVFGIRA